MWRKLVDKRRARREELDRIEATAQARLAGAQMAAAQTGAEDEQVAALRAASRTLARRNRVASLIKDGFGAFTD